MKVDETTIEGLRLLSIDVKEDDRGLFIKPYSLGELKNYHLMENVTEIFYSISAVNVLRGMHFQVPPFTQEKIVGVTHGCILDVVLDIRKNSNTYGDYTSFKLKAEDGKFLYIPGGLAHGFLSLSENSTVLYIVDTQYSPPHEGGIRYDSFGFNWPVSSPIVSERDRNFVVLDNFVSPFEMIKQ
ncbi:MAG: dTDP-4-dehydrorhamnose 3,5-epimerase family protein [Thermoplasmatales archaeon]